MKKYTTLIIALLLIFTLAGCNSTKYVAYTNYTSYIVDSSNDAYSVTTDEAYWDQVYFNKKNMADKTCLFLENSYSGSYSRSIVQFLNSYTTDIYYDENGLQFGLRSDTGELAHINFMTNDFFDAQPYQSDVENPEEYAISMATEIAGQYIDNLEDYVQLIDTVEREGERDGKTYQLTYYFVTFAKKVGGYLSSDYINIKISSQGPLASVMIGDIGVFDDIEDDLKLDVSAIDQSVSDKIDSICQKIKIKNEERTIENQKIAIAPNGDVVITTDTVLHGLSDINGEMNTGYRIITVVGKTN